MDILDFVFSKKTINSILTQICIGVFTFFICSTSKFLLLDSNFKSLLIIDVSVILIGIYIIGLVLYNKMKKKYRFSFQQRTIAFSIFMFCLFVTICDAINGAFEVLKFSFCEVVGVIHLIGIVALIIFTLMFNKAKNQSSNTSYYFAEDNPFENIQSPISEDIINIILKYELKKSFSIGLIGSWGQGKSSLIEAIKNSFNKKKDKLITFTFNPSLTHRKEDIIKSYFNELNEALSPYSGFLSSNIVSYVNQISDVISKKGFNEVKFFKSTHSESIMYSKISNEISALDRKLVIYIEDLDRLGKEEIFEVLKMIKNSSNFPNTIFIVTFDKEYVQNEICGDDITKKKYLDKFFQLEYVLRAFDKKELLENFKKILLESNFYLEQEKTLKDWLNNLFEILERHNFFETNITNMRDVKRFANNVILNLKMNNEIYSRLNPFDFANFIRFKYNYWTEFNYFCNNHNEFFEPLKSSPLSLVLDKDIYKNLPNLFEKTDLKFLFEAMFTHNHKYNAIGDKMNEGTYDTILNPENLNMLLFEMDGINFFTENELVELFNLKDGWEELIKSYSNLKVQHLIHKIQSESSKDQNSQNILDILFYLYETKPDYNFYGSYDNQIYSTIKNQKETQENLLEHLENQFLSNSKINDFHKITFINYVFKIPNSSLLSYSKINKFTQLYLKNLFNELSVEWLESDDRFFKYHALCKSILGESDLNKVCIRFLNSLENLESFCKQQLNSDISLPSFYRLSDFVEQLFQFKIEFEKFLKSHKYSKTLDGQEFYKFVFILNRISSSGSIKFVFNKFKLIKNTSNHFSLSDIEKERRNTNLYFITRTSEINFHKENDKMRLLFRDNNDFEVVSYNNQIIVISTFLLNYEKTKAVVFELLEKEGFTVNIDDLVIRNKNIELFDIQTGITEQ
jgi:hypothetical protein